MVNVRIRDETDREQSNMHAVFNRGGSITEISISLGEAVIEVCLDSTAVPGSWLR